MSIQDRTIATTTLPATARQTEPTGSNAPGRVLAVLRIGLGLTFLWAFLDKTFGWGYATTSTQAWINGGSPTAGFLQHVHVGPVQSILRAWAGAGWADWLFMLGLLGLGLALVFGVGLRPAAVTGTVLLAFMWLAEWPLATHTSTGTATASSNPLIDYHVLYAIAIIVLAVFAAGDTWGLGRHWAKLDIVRRYHWLR